MGGRGEQANEVRIISAKIVMNLQHINSLLNYSFISVFHFINHGDAVLPFGLLLSVP